MPVSEITYDGLATAMDGGTSFLTGYFDNVTWTGGTLACNSQTDIVSGSAEMEVRPPSVTNITADGATKISVQNTLGNVMITHFVTPKSATDSRVTLTATISPNSQQILNQINWEGAVESATNPLQATISKDTAKKQIVKIKYRNTVLREFRVWIVWATTTSTDIPIGVNTNAQVGDPEEPGTTISGGYNFTHTIQPAEIITEEDIPKFNVANVTQPPGGNHPVFGTPLAFGANFRWDNSRQVRAKKLNPFNISNSDIQQPPLPNSIAYPTDTVEGNDDSSTIGEDNDPYRDNVGKLTDSDSPSAGIANRAGTNGNTYEERLHYKEFVRLEIEGVWFRASDFYLWRIHFKFRKVNGAWANDDSEKALDNNNF